MLCVGWWCTNVSLILSHLGVMSPVAKLCELRQSAHIESLGASGSDSSFCHSISKPAISMHVGYDIDSTDHKKMSDAGTRPKKFSI